MSRFTALAAGLGLSFVLIFAAPAAASPPTISYSIEGIVGTHGWYRGSVYGDSVVLHWSVSGGFSNNCLAAVPVPGPTTGTTRSCTATNNEGSTTEVTAPIKIDNTPPTITASLSRKPDSNGWYNHPVAITWSGSDVTSGIAGCSSVTYGGPDSSGATVNGSCSDIAGNRAASKVRLAYDATPPELSSVTEQSTAAGDVLRWTSSSPSDRIVVRRTARGSKAHKAVFEGSAAQDFTDKEIRPGAQYLYSVQSFDQAGNSSKMVTVAGLPKVLTLRKTHYVPLAAENPILRWGRFHGARYYNVQLIRGSKRIFSAWPTAHQLGLPKSWKWSKRHFRLSPGRYRWYVWAGLGARNLARYRAVGSASFVVPRQ